MAVKQVGAVSDALLNDIHILLVERGYPYPVLVRKPDFEIARAACAVPHEVFVLPAVAKFGGKILL